MFTGREWLSALQLYDYRHRLYNPDNGRFLQSDPIGLQTEGAKLTPEQKALYGAGAPEVFASSEMNLYRYCGDDPVDKSDPTGLDFILLNRSYGFHGAGHSGALVGNNKDGYRYYTKDGKGKDGNKAETYGSVKEFSESKHAKEYDRSVRIVTNRDQDAAMKKFADKHYSDEFKKISNNCLTLSENIMKAGGLHGTGAFWPNRQFEILSREPTPADALGYGHPSNAQ